MILPSERIHDTDLGFQTIGLNQNKKTHTILLTFQIVKLVKKIKKKEINLISCIRNQIIDLNLFKYFKLFFFIYKKSRKKTFLKQGIEDIFYALK